MIPPGFLRSLATLATTLQLATPSEQERLVAPRTGRLHGLGDDAGAAEVRRNLADVEVALVHAGPLDGGHDLADRGPHGARVLRVGAVARRDEDRVRAAPERLGAAHRRADTVRAGDVVRGRHDAPAAGVTPDDERLCGELGVLELLHGREEGVQVEMRDDDQGGGGAIH